MVPIAFMQEAAAAPLIFIMLQFLAAVVAIFEPPELPTRRLQQQEQPVCIKQLDRLGAVFCRSDRSVR